MKRALLFLVFSILFSGHVKGQIKIGDNPQNIDATSVLELESNSRVLVITRINTAQMNAITPLPGAVVYNTDLQCIHYYDGTQWINVCEEVGGIPNLTTDPLINTNSTIVITPNGEDNHIEVAPNSIRTEQIVDGGINGDDIQDNSIGQSKIGNDAVGRNEIAENAVGLEALDTDQITLADFNNTPGFITGADIVSTIAGNVLTDDSGAYYDNTPVLNEIAVNEGNITTNTANLNNHITNDGDTDNQNELLTNATIQGDNLILSEGLSQQTVSLAAFNNTGSDSQNLTLAGNNLSIDNGNSVNLSGFLDNTDNQTITDFSFNPATNVITLTLQNGGTDTIDLSSLSGTGTDDQQLTLTGGNILTLESGGTVDLNPFLDNVDTDDQTITAFNFNNATNILTITLENGNTQTVDLTALAGGGGTDDQNLTLLGNVLQIEDGNSVDFTPILGSGGTDDQQLSLASNILTLEDGGIPINLTPFLDNTDDQTLTLAGNTVQIEDGNTIDLTPILGTGGTDDQQLSLAGNILTLEDGGTPVNLTPFLDNTDDQTLTLAGNTIQIEDGNTIDLTPILGSGSTDDQIAAEVPFTPVGNTASLDVQAAIEELQTEIDGISAGGAANPNDELITSFALNGTGLDIAEGGNIVPTLDLDPIFATDAELAALPIDDADADPANEIQAISSLDGSVTITPAGINDFDLSVPAGSDDQNLETATLVGTDLTINIEGGNPTTADLGALATDLELAALPIDDADADPANEIQAISSLDGSVTITPAGINDFDLSVPAGSDDQNLETATLVGTDLTINIEGGNPTTADLGALATDLELAALPIDDADADPANEIQAISSLDGSVTITPAGINDFDLSVPAGSDDQNLETATLVGTDLTINIEGGNPTTADLGALATDLELAAAITASEALDNDTDSGNELQTISSPDASVTVTPVGNNYELTVVGGSTDDQNLETATLVGTDLTINIEGGNPTTADLGALATDLELAAAITASEALDNDTDSGNELQTISSPDASVTVTPVGNNYELTVVGGGTDDQNLETATLVGTDLTINIEGGNPTTADLGALTTDLELAAAITASEALDNDTDSGNELQTISSPDASVTVTPVGNNYELTVAGGGTDDQNLETATLVGTDLTINIEGGNPTTADLGTLATDLELAAAITASEALDNDTNNTNEIQSISSPDASVTVTPVGNNYELTVAGGGTDDQNLETATLVGTDLTINIEGGNPTTADLGALATDLELAAAITASEALDNDTDSGNELQTISSPDASVTVTPVGNNYELTVVGGSTDDQNLETATLVGTDLTINIEGGNPTTADLGALTTDLELAAAITASEALDNDTDSGNELQTISSPDASVTVTPVGNNYELTVAGGGTDDQNLETATLVGTDLTINIEGGNPTTADLGTLATDLELAAAITASEALDNDTNSSNEIQTISSPDASVTVTPVGNNYELTVAGGGNNLGNTNLTQTGGNRTYDLAGQELYFTGSGSIGIGLSNPQSKLDVFGQIQARQGFAATAGTAGQPSYGFFTSGDADTGMFRAAADQMAFATGGTEAMRIIANQNVGIANAAPSERLDVTGNIRASNNFISGAQTLTVPDYVFEKYYNGYSNLNDIYSFKTLEEVETFIKTHNHLPGIVSAKEAKTTDRWNLTESSLNNLEKIEELFLHTIEQEKKIDQLKNENEVLSKELETLKSDMELIKQLVLNKEKNN